VSALAHKPVDYTSPATSHPARSGVMFAEGEKSSKGEGEPGRHRGEREGERESDRERESQV